MAMSSILNFVWALRDHRLRESMSLICIFKNIPFKCILIIISLNCNIQSWKDFIELSLSLVIISLIQMIPSFKLHAFYIFLTYGLKELYVSFSYFGIIDRIPLTMCIYSYGSSYKSLLALGTLNIFQF